MRLTRNGLLTAILVIAALFVGSFVTKLVPQPDRLATERPFLHEVTVGEPAHLRTGEVVVTAVQTAKQVEYLGNVSEAAGVWLVADIELEPVRESTMIAGSSPVVNSVDGRTFGGLQVLITNCGPTPPGMRVACQLAFELAPDALEGARLLIPAGQSVNISDDVASVDLGIDAALAAELAVTDAYLPLLESTAVTK